MAPPLRLGIVTYNIAKDWTLDEILRNLEELEIHGVELRTTHAHGVEVGLSKGDREKVKKRFEDSPVELVQLGSAFDFHTRSPEELRLSIEGAKEYAVLAHDVGASGIKVRPNGLPEGAPEEETLEQIGRSLREIGELAAGLGVEVRLEVHGKETSRLPRIRKIMETANHPAVVVNWNSNESDLEDGGFDAGFDLVKDKIRHVHINELYKPDYPYRRLFERLHEMGYSGWCMAEIQGSPDPLRLLKFYKGLFLALQDAL